MSEEIHPNDLAFEQLQAVLIGLNKSLRQALGFTHNVEYRELTFNLNRLSVIADLAPLAFVHLTEPIGADGWEMAVKRLYDRVLPLLSCRHHWISVKEGLDGPIGTVASDVVALGAILHRCSLCTACALERRETSLPVIGREDT